jgi:hypothetical protein
MAGIWAAAKPGPSRGQPAWTIIFGNDAQNQSGPDGLEGDIFDMYDQKIPDQRPRARLFQAFEAPENAKKSMAWLVSAMRRQYLS